MPLLKDDYRPALGARNPFWNTVAASKLRNLPRIPWDRQRVELPDGDFVDLDWSRVGSRRCALVIHGLGGNSRRSYMRGLTLGLNARGWDVAALNLRWCSGEVNRLPVTYHAGRTEDVAAVAALIAAGYEKRALVGFSLGGNLALKYAGETGDACLFQRVVGISAPVDLASSANQLKTSRFFTRYLLKKLEPTLKAKHAQFPGLIDLRGFEEIGNFYEYDSRFTARLNGFSGAEDYYSRSSALKVLPGVRVPALIINGQDDPFLGPGCSPEDLAKNHPWVSLLTPRYGGHVGFLQKGPVTYAEERTWGFLDQE